MGDHEFGLQEKPTVSQRLHRDLIRADIHRVSCQTLGRETSPTSNEPPDPFIVPHTLTSQLGRFTYIGSWKQPVDCGFSRG